MKKQSMNSELQQFLESGILEFYILGQASPAEQAQVEAMAAEHEAVREELDLIERTLEDYAFQHALPPDPTIKPFLMATVDYMERMAGGETPSFPPELTKESRISDYIEWLEREDLALKAPLQDINARIIGYTPQMTTAIVWLDKGAPPETHTNEFERFLIVNGTCNIIVDGQDNHLKPGDVFSIPLHLSHTVIVTSSEPCRIILQRAAA
jgi:mannose-6-phosphate isomerase-like protein (cupin superfamily)